jgi:hypothetical protein
MPGIPWSVLMRMLIVIVIVIVIAAFALGFGVRAMTESASKKCQPLGSEWTRSQHVLACPAGTVPSVGHGWKLAGTKSAGAGVNYWLYNK